MRKQFLTNKAKQKLSIVTKPIIEPADENSEEFDLLREKQNEKERINLINKEKLIASKVASSDSNNRRSTRFSLGKFQTYDCGICQF